MDLNISMSFVVRQFLIEDSWEIRLKKEDTAILINSNWCALSGDVWIEVTRSF